MTSFSLPLRISVLSFSVLSVSSCVPTSDSDSGFFSDLIYSPFRLYNSLFYDNFKSLCSGSDYYYVDSVLSSFDNNSLPFLDYDGVILFIDYSSIDSLRVNDSLRYFSSDFLSDRSLAFVPLGFSDPMSEKGRWHYSVDLMNGYVPFNIRSSFFNYFSGGDYSGSYGHLVQGLRGSGFSVDVFEDNFYSMDVESLVLDSISFNKVAVDNNMSSPFVIINGELIVSPIGFDSGSEFWRSVFYLSDSLNKEGSLNGC